MIGVVCTILAACLLSVNNPERFLASAPKFIKCAVTNYDNLDSSDDPHHSYLNEMKGVNENFLKSLPVCAISDKHWKWLGNHFLELRVRGKTFKVLALDTCSDRDQGNSCSNNMRAVGASFLVDLEKRTKDYHLPGVGDMLEAGWVRDLGRCNMAWLEGIMRKNGVQWNK